MSGAPPRARRGGAGLAIRSALQIARVRWLAPRMEPALAERMNLLPVSLSSAFAATHPPRELRRLARRVEGHYALSALDHADLLRGARCDEVRGAEGLAALRAAGRGAVVASLHFGPLYYVPAEVAAIGYRVQALMLSELDELSGENFARMAKGLGAGFEPVHSRTPAGVRQAIRSLQAGGALVAYVDGQSAAGGHRQSDRHAADLEFLGVPIRVRTGPAWIASRARVPMVPAAAFREGLGRRVVEFGPPVPAADDGGPEALAAVTRALFAWFEPRVRARPWAWGTWLAPYMLWRETGGAPTATREHLERETEAMERRLASGAGHLAAEATHVGVVRGPRGLVLHGPTRRVLEAGPLACALVDAALARAPFRDLARRTGADRGALALEIAKLTLSGLARVEE